MDSEFSETLDNLDAFSLGSVYVLALERRLSRRWSLALEAAWRKNDLEAISTTARTPEVAADLFLKTDFDGLQPTARKDLAGKGPGDERWMKELFAGLTAQERETYLKLLKKVYMTSIKK